MRIEVGTVNHLSRATLVVAALAYACWTLAASPAPTVGFFRWSDAAQLTAGYGLTILAFAAFPHRRRTDLIKAVILASALLGIGSYLLGHGLNPLSPVLATAGAIGVLIPSFMERFRSLARADPHEPFSMIYPNERRRRRGQLSLAPASGVDRAPAAPPRARPKPDADAIGRQT